MKIRKIKIRISTLKYSIQNTAKNCKLISVTYNKTKSSFRFQSNVFSRKMPKRAQMGLKRISGDF